MLTHAPVTNNDVLCHKRMCHKAVSLESRNFVSIANASVAEHAEARR
jgi:hypothetical protein